MCSVKKSILRNFAKFTGKHLPLAQVFSSEFCEISKGPGTRNIFSKYSWNLIKNIILIIFRRVAWNYFNNCLRICVFMYICFWRQKIFLNFNRFSLISLKNFEREILNFDWRQKMRFFIFRKYCRKIILRVACSKYFRNI